MESHAFLSHVATLLIISKIRKARLKFRIFIEHICCTIFKKKLWMAPFHVNSYSNSGASMGQAHLTSPVSLNNPAPVTPEALEIAGRYTESMLALDQQFPTLAEKLRIGKLKAQISKHDKKLTLRYYYSV